MAPLSDIMTPLQTEVTFLLLRSTRLSPKHFQKSLQALLPHSADLGQIAKSQADWRVDIGDASLFVSPSKKKCEDDALHAARHASLTKSKAHDYDRDVRQHRAHITLSLRSRVENATDEPVARLRILMSATLALLDQCAPSLVLWRPSNMLFTPWEIEAVADHELPLALSVHPQPTTEADKLTGLRLEGAHHFAGQTLCVDASARSFEDSYDIAISALAAKTGQLLPLDHGDILETRNGEELFVRHEAPDAKDPAGRLCLSLTAPAILETQPLAPHPVVEDLRPDEEEATSEDNIDMAIGEMVKTSKSQTSFADRVARIKTSHDSGLPGTGEVEPGQVSLTEPETDPLLKAAPVVTRKSVGASLASKIFLFAICAFGVVASQYIMTPGNGSKLANLIFDSQGQEILQP